MTRFTIAGSLFLFLLVVNGDSGHSVGYGTELSCLGGMDAAAVCPIAESRCESEDSEETAVFRALYNPRKPNDRSAFELTFHAVHPVENLPFTPTGFPTSQRGDAANRDMCPRTFPLRC